MNIIAIDTTGFNTSIACVSNGKDVIFNLVQNHDVAEYKWQEYLLELPQYHHDFLLKNIDKILQEHKLGWDDIDAIAVSAYSGIYNCVLVGHTIATALAHAHKIPIIEIDHILAHAYSTWLERDINNFNFPLLVFTASGSHSDFSHLSDKNSYQLIYNTIPTESGDGAQRFIGIGKLFYQFSSLLFPENKGKEAFTKLIGILAKGDKDKLGFRKFYEGAIFDLDFTIFMERIAEYIYAQKKSKQGLSSSKKQEIALSWQATLVDILCEKIIYLAHMLGVKEVHIAGGISVNTYFKQVLRQRLQDEIPGVYLRLPVKKSYSFDNAAMIGILAYWQSKLNINLSSYKPIVTK